VDQAGLLDRRDELLGADQHAVCSTPAHKCLDAHQPPGVERGLGLVVQHQVVALDRLAQLAEQRQTLRTVLVQLGV
jgi:hypothetical protein